MPLKHQQLISCSLTNHQHWYPPVPEFAHKSRNEIHHGPTSLMIHVKWLLILVSKPVSWLNKKISYGIANRLHASIRLGSNSMSICRQKCFLPTFCQPCKTQPAMLVGVMPTQLTYCVTFIGYQYISGWCSRQHHCVTDRAGSANQHTFHRHHTYQPAISDHLTPTDWTNHRPGLLSANDVSVTMRRTSGTLFRRLSDPLTVTTPSRPG